ncbi:unnamed protein product, partial [Symbiodinium pilosum]
MVIQDSLESRDNNLGNNLEGAGMEGVAQHEGGVRSTAAGSASRGPTRETDTIGAMLEEEIAIQETKEQSRLAEEARLRQQVEEHERLESEEEMQQLKDDEDRWERHRAAQLQEQEDKLMAEALAGKSLKRKFTVVTSVLGRDGKILGTSSQEVQAAAGENVRVQFEIQENEAIQSDPEQDSAEHEVEVDACDEEVLQQAQEEWPELSWHPHERLRKAWFHLWKVGVLSGAQIERRWGLEVLWEFEAELAEELVRQRATQASQDILASQMERPGLRELVVEKRMALLEILVAQWRLTRRRVSVIEGMFLLKICCWSLIFVAFGYLLGSTMGWVQMAACWKELWFGRVWELRELLRVQHEEYLARVNRHKPDPGLSATDKQALDALLQDPKKKSLLTKLCALWKGVVVRRRNSLRVLSHLKYSYLRGTVIYAHGSGGCSWDNFRICRMMARMGMLVIAPDGFAYPKNTDLGKMRHKEVQPLKRASDDVDYWANDLLYASNADGSHTYSTQASSVLDNPDKFRDLYEKCYQMRRRELHWTIEKLPRWIRTQGFFIGGTSEGAMTVSRFDDQRYAHQVLGRFINSFSVEYCYFTPTMKCAQIGGNTDVPTLNIIGTKDEYFGATES